MLTDLCECEVPHDLNVSRRGGGAHHAQTTAVTQGNLTPTSAAERAKTWRAVLKRAVILQCRYEWFILAYRGTKEKSTDFSPVSKRNNLGLNRC